MRADGNLGGAGEGGLGEKMDVGDEMVYRVNRYAEFNGDGLEVD